MIPSMVWQKYLNITMAYGFVHALTRVYSRKTEYRLDRPVDELMVDKLTDCMLTSGTGPVLWPWYLYKDARILEIVARGKPRDNYPGTFFE